MIAVEDASRYRDALHVALPSGIARSLLETVDSPLADLVSRFARTHGPFIVDDVCHRFGLDPESALATLIELAQTGRVIMGNFTDAPATTNTIAEVPEVKQWCDANVLRTLKQRSLARVREQIKPVAPDACSRFLIDWHGIGRRRKGTEALLDVVEQLQGLPLPASCLERDILPARLPEYRPGELDELCSAGEVIWQGSGTLGNNDGRIALFLADAFDQLRPSPDDESTQPDDEIANQIRAFLSSHGAVFFGAIHASIGGFRNDVFDALWRLVWNGEVTNDTLAPVRSLHRSATSSTSSRAGQTPSGRRSSSRRSGRMRSRRSALLPGTEGRWSLLVPPVEPLSTTEQKMEQVRQLLDRMGIVTRESVAAENLGGGFSAVYPILRALEDSGQIRRGYFIEGLSAAQFAAPGADERLRNQATPDESTRARTIMLSAVDPANPFGTVVPWPELAAEKATRPQRTAGALVIAQGGFAIGYLNRNFDSLTTFRQTAQQSPTPALANAIADLARNRGPIMLTSIDGFPAATSDLAPDFVAAEFQSSSSGLRHRGI